MSRATFQAPFFLPGPLFPVVLIKRNRATLYHQPNLQYHRHQYHYQHTHTLSLSVTANSFISIRVTSRQVYPSHDSLSIQLSCKHPRSMTKEFINAIYVSTPTSMGWCPVWHSEDGRSILSIVFIQSSPHLFSLSFSHYLVR